VNSIASFKTALGQWASSDPAVRRVWIFGSVAKGKPNPADLDVAVELEASDPTQYWMDHSTQWRRELQALLPISLQLEYFDPRGSTPTISNGLAEAKCLAYERAS
jgi:predicted nucleotidyltransferase